MEYTPDPARTLDRIHSQNIKVGLGFNPDNAYDEATRFFPDLDLLLLLGVYPGFGGQAMHAGMVEKIASVLLLAYQPERRFAIAVDGGVKPENAASLAEAGANCLIMGTALFQSLDMTETIGSIRESIARLPRH